MAAFEYKALGANGKKTSGIINADTKKQARSQLKKAGLFPTEVKEQQSGKATSGDGLNVEIDFSKYFERVSSQELAEMTNQMETLIRTSVSIDETLAILSDQTENNMLRLALVEIKDKVTKGLSLSEAMKDHPKIFDKLYVSLVEVGQETGQLDEILGRLREHTGKMVELQQKVIKAISYPLLTMLISGGVVLGIFVGVIPRIRKLFDTFGATLPLPTQIVLAISDFLLNRWYIPLALVIIVAYTFPKWVNTENGRYKFDAFKLNIPFFGNLFRMISTSRFSRTLATLLKGGLPLAEALPIAQNVLQNVVLEEVVDKANQNIISKSFCRAPTDVWAVSPIVGTDDRCWGTNW